jgi:hypothetical protein
MSDKKQTVPKYVETKFVNEFYDKFVSRVNEYIAQGYEPLGGMSMSAKSYGNEYSQIMAKRNPLAHKKTTPQYVNYILVRKFVFEFEEVVKKKIGEGYIPLGSATKISNSYGNENCQAMALINPDF